MDVSDLAKRTKLCSFQDIRLELPPNQTCDIQAGSTLLGKIISSKNLSLSIIKDIVTKAWRRVYPLEVKKLHCDIFLFRFQHESDAHKAYSRCPWSVRGGHLILKKWSPNLSWQEV